MENNNFSPQESLALIENMIQKAQNRFAENGHLYLLWGWVVFFCSLSQFVLLHFFNYKMHYLVWLVTWLVFVYQIYYIRKNTKKRPVKTYYDEILSYVWLSFVVLLFLIGLTLSKAGVKNQVLYLPITPCLLALYGMPTFLSGIVLRFKPLVWGGVGCWLLSIIASLTITSYSYAYQLLFVPAAMLIAWIIPGYLMRKKFLQTN